MSTFAYKWSYKPTMGVKFSVIFHSIRYPTNAEKHQEPTEERRVEHAFYHGIVDLMFRVGLQGADVKAAATIMTTERGVYWRQNPTHGQWTHECPSSWHWGDNQHVGSNRPSPGVRHRLPGSSCFQQRWFLKSGSIGQNGQVLECMWHINQCANCS